MDKNLIIVSKYTFIYMIVLLFAVLSVATIAIQLFRAGIDDGSEIIIIAKPISRSSIVWGKLTVFLGLSLLISGIACFLSIFTLWTPYGGKVIGDSLILGSFLGTMVIYLLFGSIAIMLSLIVKKLGTILITVGLFCVLIVYGMVATFTITTPSKKLTDNENVGLQAVSLVQKSDKKNELNYQWGSLAKNNNQLIDAHYLHQIEPNNQKITPGNYLQTKWDEAINNQSYKGVMYTNFLYQFVNLYALNWSEQFNVPFTIYQTIVSSNASPYIDLNFKNVNLNQKDQDNTFANSLLGLTYYYPSNNNGVNKVETQNYYLTNNIKFASANVVNRTPILTDYGTDYAQGAITNMNTEVIHLPWVDFSKPQLNLNDYLKMTEISANSTAANPYEDFINTFFNPQVIKVIDAISAQLVKHGIELNPLSYYASIFSMYDLIQDGSLPPNLLFSKQNLKNLLNRIATQVTIFQYWTYLALTHMSQDNNYDLQNARLQHLMMYCLMPSNTKTFAHKNNVATLLMTPNNLLFNLKVYQNNPQQAIINLKQALYGIYPFFTLTQQKDLVSFTIVKGANFYNMPSLVAGWVIVSFGFMFIAMALYARRDFS